MEQKEETGVLNQFKKFDLFRKTSREITYGSSSGALVSIIAAVLIFLLIATEIPSLFQMEVQSQLYIDKAETHEKAFYFLLPFQYLMLHQVQVNINLVLHKLPCMIATLSMKDALGTFQGRLEDGLKKTIILPGQKEEVAPFKICQKDKILLFQAYENKEVITVNDLEEALKSRQGCRLEGYFYVNKVPGFFSISVAAYHGILQLMRSRNVEAKIDLTHTLYSLTFGENEDVRTLQKMFGRNLININQRQALEQLREQRKEDGFHFSYYLNIIPAQFKLPNNKIFNIFQYTINSNLVGVEDYSAIFFRYEFAGVSVQYQKQPKIQFFHFLVQLCAIIGGIFSLAGLTDAWITKLVGKFQDFAKGSREIENTILQDTF